MTNEDDLSRTIDPNSDQINADDLIAGNKIIRIRDIKMTEGRDRPMWIYFYGDKGKPYKPNITMRKLLIYAWGANRHDWIGHSMELYNDPETVFGGKKVGGIKVKRISHITKEIRAMLQTTRGKRADFVIGVLPEYSQELFDKNKTSWIEAMRAKKLDMETLLSKAEGLTDEQILQLQKEIKNENINDGNS